MNTSNQINESSINEPLDESTSYVDQYENIPLDDDNPEEEPIVNEEDTITNDQDNLDQEFLDALQEDEEQEEIYDDQNNLDKSLNNLDKGDPDADDDRHLGVDDLYKNNGNNDNDLADNDLNDLEGDHLNNPDLDREEQNIRNKDSFKID
ncbi:hypothetical protein SAMN05444397_11265 [Flavobacterium aquidurense]|uniref:Highly acidic protein n=1 Tax=Flavobacterium frigidimaris TaxID=262320 RepID=A0ABX4BL22_FLAFR|nr:hypothetical protein [Flavobacterium frigidimaris]OXA75917.1 hypothetical protein B0A65_20405 [Flavobacterium frigidimaris]SDZ64008.1 hypothetical protein SAMN05444397_11265 [Flavobacterium aquidurense]